MKYNDVYPIRYKQWLADQCFQNKYLKTKPRLSSRKVTGSNAPDDKGIYHRVSGQEDLPGVLRITKKVSRTQPAGAGRYENP